MRNADKTMIGLILTFVISAIFVFSYTRQFIGFEEAVEETRVINTAILELNREAWNFYYAGEFADALENFKELRELDPENLDHELGVGFSQLQLEKFDKSAQVFDRILEKNPESTDALYGKSLVYFRQEQFAESKKALNTLLALDPHFARADELNQKLLHILEFRSVAPATKLPGVKRPEELQLHAKAEGNSFFIPEGDEWKPIFIKGINLGGALPGKFPGEFSRRKGLYRSWLKDISAMNANTVRLYTILPPEFYDAFYEHNSNPQNKRLWLVHNVWAELPEDLDFLNEEFEQDFQEEVENMIDVVHGHAVIDPRPGESFGIYDKDVSPYTLGIIIGREWESFAVQDFNKKHPELKSHEGQYLSLKDGNAMEAWLTKHLDQSVIYQMETYNSQTPITFSNWPPLDPLYHPSETSYVEEHRFLEKRHNIKLPDFDLFENDVVDVTVSKLIPQEGFEAGLFSSYHIYPYYPDFMINDPAYQTDGVSESMYLKYLQALKEVYTDMPLLVAEYGVPNSRGIAHVHPHHWNNGHMTEEKQGEIIALMTKDLVTANTAGGILFEWIDEWHKKNWLVADTLIPLARNRLWFNTIDPEQNFGLMAMRPGDEKDRINLRGDREEWDEAEQYSQNFNTEKYHDWNDGFDSMRHLEQLSAVTDPGYLYLRLDVKDLDPDGDGEINFDKTNFVIGIDTYGEKKDGEHVIPFGTNALVERGLEFIIVIQDKENASLKIHQKYNTRREVTAYGYTMEEYAFPIISDESYEGNFSDLEMEVNRLRVMRNGTIVPRKTFNQSPLQFGSLDKDNPDYNSLADWYADPESNTIEIRIPWSLLNMTDPSKRFVLHSPERKVFAGQETEGFHFYALSYLPGEDGITAVPKNGEHDANINDALPLIATDGSILTPVDVEVFSWKKWEIPDFHTELKDSYPIVQELFGEL